jgi:hypothetical protein
MSDSNPVSDGKPGNRAEKLGNGSRLVGFIPQKLTSAHWA